MAHQYKALRKKIITRLERNMKNGPEQEKKKFESMEKRKLFVVTLTWYNKNTVKRCDGSIKLGRLGATNRILDDSDSDSNKFRQWFESNSKSDTEIRIW